MSSFTGYDNLDMDGETILQEILDNMVTIDSDQTITGEKTFEKVIINDLSVNNQTTFSTEDGIIHQLTGNTVSDNLDYGNFATYNDEGVKYKGIINKKGTDKFYVFHNQTTMPETSLDLNTQSLASLVVREPVAQNEVATKAFVESHGGGNFLPLSGGTMTGVLNMNNRNLIMSSTLAPGLNSSAIIFPNNNRILTLSNSDMVMYRNNDHYIAVGNAGPYVGSRLNLQTNRIIGLGPAIDNTDAVNLNQLNSLGDTKLNLDGSSTMTGAINMGNKRINNLGGPIAPNDAVNITYLNGRLTEKLSLTGGALSGNLTFSGDNQIINPAAITLRNAGKIMSIQNGTFIQPFSDSTTNNARIIAFTERDNDTERTLTLDLYTKLTTFGGQIDMDNNQIYGLLNGSSPSSAVNKSQLDLKFNTDGSTNMGGSLKMNGNNIIMENSLSGDSNSINWASSPAGETNRILTIGNGNLVLYGSTGSFFAVAGTSVYTNRLLNMNSNKITNVLDPTNLQDCATKKYVDDSIPTSNANTPLAVMYNTVRFEMNSFTWQACKFLIPSNIQSGRFLFNADISIWDSDNTLSPENITSNKCYIDYRICDNAGNPLETYTGKRIEDLCFNNGNLIVPKPMNKTNTAFYYSNATTSINYEIPLTTASQFNEIQFQCRWSQFVIFTNDTISSRTPADGFTDMRVILTILPTV